MCGTLNCEHASICEKIDKYEEMSTINVNINSKCEMFYAFSKTVFLAHMESFFTFRVDISSHLATFSHIEAFHI